MKKMMRDDGELSELVRRALEDRFEGFELVEFLDVPTDRIIEVLYEEIVDNLEEVLEFLGMESSDEVDEEYD